MSKALTSHTLDRLSRIVAFHQGTLDQSIEPIDVPHKVEMGESTATTMKHSTPAIDDLQNAVAEFRVYDSIELWDSISNEYNLPVEVVQA